MADLLGGWLVQEHDPERPARTKARRKGVRKTSCSGKKGSAQPLGRKYRLILSPSVLNRTEVPRNWRMAFLVRLIMPWRLRDWVNSTFPVAVILKRFLAPDLVFSLGILLSCSGRTHLGKTARSAGDASIKCAD